ncbi:MAG: GGDEF domain-containing protein, partial [Candidatus Omnitrophica bacterium]|nr:GGDEF domain-containing protein [Candidatus Omnitrophota bacterium]
MAENVCPDFLTGFSLRDSLYPTLEKLMLEFQAQKKPFSLALLDLDRFKKFNDKFGHDFGDEILRYASSTLRMTVSEVQSLLFRYGG